MKTIFIFTFSLLSSIAFAQTSADVKAVDAFLLAGDNSKIIPYLETRLKQNPKNEELLRMLGFQHMQQDDLVSAEKYYRDALVLNPDCGRCEMNMGNIYARKGDYKTALNYLEKAIVLAPNDSTAFITRGRLKEMLGDDQGALKDFDKAIFIAPKNLQGYITRGWHNAKKEFHSSALPDFNKAIALAPQNPVGYFGRAGVYVQQQQYADALLDINKAIEFDDKNFELYISQGVIYNYLGMNEKTLSSYSKSIELNSNYFLSYLNRSKTYYQLENLEASCADLNAAKRLIQAQNVNNPTLLKEIEESLNDYCDNNKASYYYQGGIAKYNTNKYQEAVELYNTGLVKFANHPMLLAFKGNALLALSQNENALKAYQASFENKATLVAALKQNQRMANASVADLEKAYNLTLSDIHSGIATATLNLGDFKTALKQINVAIKLKEGVENIGLETFYNLRGNIYLATEQYELAETDFTNAISINKNFPLGYVNRAIAKAGLIEKTKISSLAFGGKVSNQPMKVLFSKSKQKVIGDLMSAIKDCDKAIMLDEKMGFAYYIRGQLKLLSNQNDYCADLLKAKGLGSEIEPELLKNCGQ